MPETKDVRSRNRKNRQPNVVDGNRVGLFCLGARIEPGGHFGGLPEIQTRSDFYRSRESPSPKPAMKRDSTDRENAQYVCCSEKLVQVLRLGYFGLGLLRHKDESPSPGSPVLGILALSPFGRSSPTN
jgi:hypothetical protein